MKHVIHKQKTLSVAYDAELVDIAGEDIFSVDFWNDQRAVEGEAIGRGSAWFINAPFGPVVLRHYLRGGWVAKFSRQSYIFTGVSRSRPFKEYHLLAALYEKGLPVPRPVTALCRHRGLLASGALMTCRVLSAQTLADLLPGLENNPGPDAATWAKVGRCIRRFHDAGVWHADLNARNILLDHDQQVYLVDFDKARFTPAKPVNGKNNLDRLRRSLLKLWPAAKVMEIEPAWKQLMAAYNE